MDSTSDIYFIMVCLCLEALEICVRFWFWYVVVLLNVWRTVYIICWYVHLRERVEEVGCVACVGEKTHVYRVLVGKPEGKRPIAAISRLEYNIKGILR